jgi:hypothetical protein
MFKSQVPARGAFAASGSVNYGNNGFRMPELKIAQNAARDGSF